MSTYADETELARALAHGEKDAVVAVYRQNVNVVTRVLVRMGIDRTDTEDLIQTTFLEVIRTASAFERRSSIRSWIVGIALNHARNYVRSRVRSRKYSALIVASPEDTSPEPHELLVGAQSLDRLQQALDELPPLQREAIILCEIEEFPAKEVSQITGAPASTIWRRVHDAKRSLRAIFDRYEKERISDTNEKETARSSSAGEERSEQRKAVHL